jgi:hypothetical protein
MWSGSDYVLSMAVRETPRKRRLGLEIAVWFSLVLGVYAVLAVASILGLLTGGFAGALGGIIAVAVLTDRPPAKNPSRRQSGARPEHAGIRGVRRRVGRDLDL